MFKDRQQLFVYKKCQFLSRLLCHYNDTTQDCILADRQFGYILLQCSCNVWTIAIY